MKLDEKKQQNVLEKYFWYILLFIVVVLVGVKIFQNAGDVDVQESTGCKSRQQSEETKPK